VSGASTAPASRAAAAASGGPGQVRLAPRSLGVEGLDGQRFDAVVIGGGILGAGVARELARRGQRTLLVERRDFGWGTTARSTRLIHGGLRYLANYDIGLVREGLRERAWLLEAVPNLVTPLAFLLPFYDTPFPERLRIRAGLTLYDLLSPRHSLPGHRMLGRDDVARLEPGLARDGLDGAALYWDAQVELPERLVIEALRAADEAGAELRNHVAATGLIVENGGVSAVHLTAAQELPGRVEDAGTATVATPLVINASGPWADATLAALGVARPPILRLTQGVHVIYPRLAEHALAFVHPDDGRLCFAIPWQGQTMVGTTETDVDGSADDARIRPEDVVYLERAVAFCFPDAVDLQPLWGSVGVRSLMRDERLASDVSRRHLLIEHKRDGAAGLVTVAGGKLTAWRSIAADVVDGILHRRDRYALRGAFGRPGALAPPPDPGEGPSAERLWRLYGARRDEVLRWSDEDPWWAEPLLPGHPAVRAEVVHALEREWAGGIADIVLRRLALGFGADLGWAAAAAVAEVGEVAFGWDRERISRELRALEDEERERVLPTSAGSEAAAR
jgi:glycerol-3-phosphate dehydrogenase